MISPAEKIGIWVEVLLKYEGVWIKLQSEL